RTSCPSYTTLPRQASRYRRVGTTACAERPLESRVQDDPSAWLCGAVKDRSGGAVPRTRKEHVYASHTVAVLARDLHPHRFSTPPAGRVCHASGQHVLSASRRQPPTPG